MRVRVFPTALDAASDLAHAIARAVERRPALVLGLPTGRTSIPLYRELTRIYSRRRLNLSKVTTFNLDEFLGIPASHPGSYRAFMQRYLFDHVHLPRRRVHFLDGMARDTDVECARYERAIGRAGGIDLMILGLGANGHIGFNEPGRALMARTHRTALTPSTRAANASLFGGDVDRVPRHALSMGMTTILHASRIVLLATGAGKARCVKGMIEGPLTTGLPASFLQLHRGVDVWLDRAAASKLNPP